MKYTRTSAELSPCGKFRFVLSRDWTEGEGRCCFIMLNPSTADAESDDPTIRRCVDFARRSGHSALDVVNLFALRTPHPRELLTAADLHGPRDQAQRLYNDIWLLATAALARTAVAAWGVHGVMHHRDRVVREMLKEVQLHCLGTTANGQPRHPLYIPAHTPFRKYVDVIPAMERKEAAHG
jgi:hypothetical protein